MTNALSQAEYRRRMKDAGYSAHLVWARKGVKIPSVWDNCPHGDGETARLRAKIARLQAKIRKMRALCEKKQEKTSLTK